MNKTAILAVIALFSQSLKSQSITAGTISSFAGTVYNATISIDYSVGETAISTIGNSSSCVTQGFLQPKSSVFTSERDYIEGWLIEVFPNPISDYVVINNEKNMNWTIYDCLGKIISTGNDNRIRTDWFSAGVYYLVITDKQRVYNKTIKLIKN